MPLGFAGVMACGFLTASIGRFTNGGFVAP
jgi:hypothetical protein